MIDIFELGFIKMPGLIFSLDIDGIIWFITVKLLLFILGIILAIVVGIFSLVFSGAVSLFVYPYAIWKNIKHPED